MLPFEFLAWIEFFGAVYPLMQPSLQLTEEYVKDFPDVFRLLDGRVDQSSIIDNCYCFLDSSVTPGGYERE